MIDIIWRFICFMRSVNFVWLESMVRCESKLTSFSWMVLKMEFILRIWIRKIHKMEKLLQKPNIVGQYSTENWSSKTELTVWNPWKYRIYQTNWFLLSLLRLWVNINCILQGNCNAYFHIVWFHRWHLQIRRIPNKFDCIYRI